MLLRIGKPFEVEVTRGSLYVKVGSFERFYNRMGLPNGAWPKDSY